MMLAILACSLTTALSARAWNWESFAVLRFLVGVGIGSEWATGASLVSELWPDHARGKGGGLLQSGAGIGSFLACGVWLLIGDLGPTPGGSCISSAFRICAVPVRNGLTAGAKGIRTGGPTSSGAWCH